MKYLELREALKSFTLFSIREIRKIDRQFHRRRLNDWQEKGYIKKIIRGYYTFSDMDQNEHTLFEIANKIYSPSYVSLEMALSYYRLIPEGVYVVTSVSSRKTYKYATPVGDFSYRKIKPDLFFGYNLLDSGDKHFKIATIEKTILDYFYLNPRISQFESLRINITSFWDQIDEEKLFLFMEKFAQKRLSKTIYQFWEFMKNA